MDFITNKKSCKSKGSSCKVSGRKVQLVKYDTASMQCYQQCRGPPFEGWSSSYKLITEIRASSGTSPWKERLKGNEAVSKKGGVIYKVVWKSHAEIFHQTSASAPEGHEFQVCPVSYMPVMYGSLTYARVFHMSVGTYGDALGCLVHLKASEAGSWSRQTRGWSKFRWGYLS